MSKKIIFGIIATVILIGGGVLYYFTRNVQPSEVVGITIEQPTANQEVQFPLTVKGYINGNGWGAFEGVAGSVQVFDANGNAITDRTPLQATTDWMQRKVSFETTIGDAQTMNNLFTPTGVLVFKNENTKGDPADDKEFRLPIKFANTQTASLKTYTNTTSGIQFQYPNTWQIIYQNVDSTIVKIMEPSSSNSFEVRNISDFDLKSLQTGKLKVDSGWAIAPMSDIYSRLIYKQDKKINIVMSVSDLSPEVKKVEDKILSTFKFTIPTSACTPNWQCGWGSCINGSQSQVVVDANNCGVSSLNANIACPALARICPETDSIIVNLPPGSACVWGVPCDIAWQANGLEGNVSIILDGFVTGSNLPYTISTVPVYPNFYSWIVPSSGYIPEANAHYKIKICGSDSAGTLICGESNYLSIWKNAQ